MKLDVIYNEDFLEGVRRLPDKSVNLIIADPPYNIKKAEWDNIPDYINWSGKWMLECQRVLKDNGSFYLFHNDFLQIVKIQNWINKNSKFVFKQLVVWNKKFEGYWNQLNAIVESEGNRNYSKQAEYLLFYTFQDETGLEQILPLCFKPYLDYMKKQKENLGWSVKKINKFLGYATIAGHWFHMGMGVQPRFISEKDYKKLQITGFFQKPYEDLRLEYEDLRREYENLRYVFNNQKTHHSVWNYEIAKKNGHITPKPIPLIENILKHSSNEDDIVLIPFVGSGNDCIACRRLGRRFIGYETKKEYCQIAQQGLEAERTLWDRKE